MFGDSCACDLAPLRTLLISIISDTQKENAGDKLFWAFLKYIYRKIHSTNLHVSKKISEHCMK